MGVYYYVDDAADAVRALRQAGPPDLSVFSPVPHHEIERALEQGPSLVRWVTFSGGVLGITGGFALCIYAVLSYPLVVGGKELISLPPFVVIGYESMILLGGALEPDRHARARPAAASEAEGALRPALHARTGSASGCRARGEDATRGRADAARPRRGGGARSMLKGSSPRRARDPHAVRRSEHRAAGLPGRCARRSRTSPTPPIRDMRTHRGAHAAEGLAAPARQR